MKFAMAALAALFLFASGAQKSNHAVCRAKPPMLCNVFAKIDDSLSSKEKETLRDTPASELIKFHFSFGATLRQWFHLWSQNDLTRYFRSLGVSHPEIMSDMLTRAYVQYLNGQEVNLPAMSRAAMPPPPPPEPPGYRPHGL